MLLLVQPTKLPLPWKWTGPHVIHAGVPSTQQLPPAGYELSAWWNDMSWNWISTDDLPVRMTLYYVFFLYIIKFKLQQGYLHMRPDAHLYLFIFCFISCKPTKQISTDAVTKSACLKAFCRKHLLRCPKLEQTVELSSQNKTKTVTPFEFVVIECMCACFHLKSPNWNHATGSPKSALQREAEKTTAGGQAAVQ